MLTLLHGLFPDVFPSIREVPDSIAWVIVGLELYAFIISPMLWKCYYKMKGE